MQNFFEETFFCLKTNHVQSPPKRNQGIFMFDSIASDFKLNINKNAITASFNIRVVLSETPDEQASSGCEAQ